MMDPELPLGTVLRPPKRPFPGTFVSSSAKPSEKASPRFRTRRVPAPGGEPQGTGLRAVTGREHR